MEMISQTSGPMSDKVRFAEKMMDIMEYMEDNCNEGDYLHISNELKTLFEMVKDLFKSEDTKPFITHLTRCYNMRHRRQTRRENVKKLVCMRCGRRVVDMDAHQARPICQNIREEKITSKQFQNELANAHLHIHAETIQHFWRKVRN